MTGCDELDEPAVAEVEPEDRSDELVAPDDAALALEEPDAEAVPPVLEAPEVVALLEVAGWAAITPTIPANAAAESPTVTRRARAAGWRRRGPGLLPAPGARRPLGEPEGVGREGCMGRSSGRRVVMAAVSAPETRPRRGARKKWVRNRPPRGVSAASGRGVGR